MAVTAEGVRIAHGDAWQAEGLLRRPYGGDVATLPGVRLMASGLPHVQWNNGDVDDVERCDVAAVAAWYGSRGLPWGLRVPAGATFPHGRVLFRKRLMGLEPDGLQGHHPVPGLRIRRAALGDLDAVLHVDAVAFEEDREVERLWLLPRLAAPGVEVALASVDDTPVATAAVVRSDGRAGPAAYLSGVAVLPAARRRGIATALSAWLLERAFDDGAELAHLHPDDDAAASVYARLGFVEVAGLDVVVDVG